MLFGHFLVEGDKYLFCKQRQLMSNTGVHCNALAEMESEPLFILGKGHLIQALFIIETKMQFIWAAVSC